MISICSTKWSASRRLVDAVSKTDKRAIKDFVDRWQRAEGNEQREANSFWIELAEHTGGE